MSWADKVKPCVVLDNGSHRIKAGIAGDDSPRSVFRTVVGMPLFEGQTIGGRLQKKYYVGEQVIENMDVLDIRRPIERGIVTDWDVMEKIWHHVFEDLRTVPSENNVLLSEPPMNPKSNREKMAQIMFDKIQPLGMYVFSPNVLSLYSSGRGSGLVIDSGYEVTDVSCIYEGYKLNNSTFRADIGGNDITHYLIELLGKQGYMFTTAKEVEEVNMMKERCAYVSQKNIVDNIQRDYTFSNGTTISLGYERYQCMEAMFKPNLIGSDVCGIHELIAKSIEGCPIHIRSHICANIIVSGSNTMAAGMASRLEEELRALLPRNIKVQVVAPPERSYSTWIGGSIEASLSSSQCMWITPADYEEFGPNVVYRSKST
ncbi:actin-2-like isoform X3 [Mizuhopecten yessoensis]|uniref:actin-2-like isoform X3 n=1 Tax=Mizuhopecten yessoensis TaxID=6573 RepID=UPI000B45A4DB|nr:actin-2-like isoform X3 [Mizuhopecten yessoensis]